MIPTHDPVLARAAKWGADRARYAIGRPRAERDAMAAHYSRVESWRDDARALSSIVSEQQACMEASAAAFRAMMEAHP